jgi:hypothetical protein
MTLGSRAEPDVLADPVMSAKSLDDLVKNRDFSPVQYWGANPKTRNIPGMEDLLTKVWVAKEQAPMDLSAGGIRDFIEKAGRAALGVGKQAIAAQAAINKAKSGNMTQQEAVQFASEAAAGVESGNMQFVDFAAKLYHGLASPAIWLAKKASKALGVEPSEEKQNEVHKAGFIKAATWAEQMNRVATGKGEFAKSELGRAAGVGAMTAVNPGLLTTTVTPVTPSPGGTAPGKTILTLPSLGAEDLKAAGLPEPNPDVVGGIALAANPQVLLPVAAATGAVSKTISRLAAASGIADTAIGGWAVDLAAAASRTAGRVGAAVAPSNVVARAAQVSGGAVRGVGNVLRGGPSGTILGTAEAAAGAFTGHALVGGVIGVLTAAAAKLAGSALAWSGQKIIDIGTRIRQRSGFLFQILDATFNAPVAGAARAVATTLPLAALMPKEDQPGFVGSMAAIGAATGAAMGVTRGAGIAATGAGQHAALKTFAENFRGPEVPSPGYGDTALDSAHLNSMAQTDPVSKSVISHVREFMRNLPTGEGKPSRTEMYLLEDKPFQDVAGGDGSGWITHEVIAPDGTRVHRIFINRTGSKYSPYHEAAHALEAYLDQFHPDQAAEVHASIDALPAESLQMFDDLYTAARVRDNPGQKIDPLTPKQLHSEVFAEMVGAFLKGSDLNGIPRPVHASIWGALGIALEDMGIYVPGRVEAGATPVAPGARTPMGITPSFKVAGEASKALHGAGVGPQNRGPLASPQVFPETPLAGGKPPKFTNVTPKGALAAPGPATGLRGPRVGPIAPVQSDDASWRQVLDNADAMGLTPEQRDAVQRLYDHRQAAGSAAEVGPVELNYESVEPGTSGQPPTRTPVRTAQEQAYIEEALTGLPSELRNVVAKLFVPGRLVVRPMKAGAGQNVNVLGFSPEKPLANAVNAARAAVAKEGVGTDLVPYTTDANGLTAAAAAEYVADLGKWSQNVSHGRLGTGEEMVVPETYQGQLPEVDPNYVPQPLSRERADFVNLTMGIEPPRSARVSAPRRNPDTGKLITRPGNVEAADLAAANKRALTGATFSKGQFKLPTGDQPIQEPNQLRARYAADSPGKPGSGIQLDKLMHEVTEEINVENIVAPITPVESSFRANKLTGPTTAGFMPKKGDVISITAPDGKLVDFLYDGMVDYTAWGMPGQYSSLTALENGPGVTKHSTYMFGEKTLGDLGYKVPDLLTPEPGQPPPVSSVPEGMSMPKPGDENRISLPGEVYNPKGHSGFRTLPFRQRYVSPEELSRVRSGETRNPEQVRSDALKFMQDAKWPAADIEGELARIDQRQGQAMPKGAGGPQQPKVDGNAIRKSETLKVDLEAMKAGTSFGTTINLDGTPWIPPAGSKLDIVSVGSFDFPRANLSNEVVAKLVHKNSKFFLSVPDSRPGLFNLDTIKGLNGEDMSSIDLNVAVDQAHRANTVAFAKANGQQAIWDALNEVQVDTGGSGTPKIVSMDEMIAAANAIVEGRPHSFLASKSPSGAIVPRATPKSSGQAMPKEKVDYPAVYSDGKIFIGPSHFSIVDELVGRGDNPQDMHHGWFTSGKRFLDSDLNISELSKIDRRFKSSGGGEEPLVKGEELAKAQKLEGVQQVTPVRGAAMPRSNAYGELDTADRSVSSGPRSVRNLHRPGEEVSAIVPLSTVGKKLTAEGYTFTGTLDASRSVLELIAFDKAGDRVGDIELTKYPGEPGWTTALVNVATAHRRKGIGEALTREAANVIQDMTGATRLYGNIVSPKAFALREKVFGVSDTPEVVVAKGKKALADYMAATAEGVPDAATDTGYFDIGTVASRIRPASEGRYAPKLEDAVGEPIKVVHYSSQEGLTEVSPEFFGRGKATPTDRRGGDKTYFFVKGSELGQDRAFAVGGLNRYEATLDGKKIYDATKGDPENWYGTTNRAVADTNLIDKGYDGIYVETQDGRKVVAMFKPVDVKAAGVTKEQGENAGAFMAKLPDLTGEFDLGQDVTRESLLARARRTIRQSKSKFEEAVPLKPMTDSSGNVKVNKHGVPLFQKHAYNFEDSPLWRRLAKESPDGDPIPALVKRLLPEFREAMKDPKSREGIAWYQEAQQLIEKKLGVGTEDSNLFSQLLAATSAQTDPVQNFNYAFDLFNQVKSGEFEPRLKRYVELLNEWEDYVPQQWRELTPVYFRENPTARVARIRDLQTWILDKEGILPRSAVSGKRIGTNSRAALDVLAGRWLETNGGDKTRRYFQNLTGDRVEGTVDRWAARWLHRQLNEGERKQWRILPQAESAVQHKDYAAGNSVLQALAKHTKLATPEVQAVLWFWEKQLWAANDWTSGSGREMSSYTPQLKRMEQLPGGKLRLKPEDLKPAAPRMKTLDLLGKE